MVENDEQVSLIEYTEGNYDKNGKLIKGKLPTLTTNHCEIGCHEDEIYFVFIVKSESFERSLFDKIQNKPNVSIYGFKDFKTTLYPKKEFNYNAFRDAINKDIYVQIQFDFKDIDEEELFNEYSKLTGLFERNGIEVVNQRKTNLTG